MECLPLTIVTIVFLQVQEFAEHSDAILLVVVPAASVREVGISKALKLAQELDSDGTPLITMFFYLNSSSSSAQYTSMPSEKLIYGQFHHNYLE